MGVYAQNATDLVMLGGYAVTEITDTLKKFKTYSNISTFSTFLDLTTNGNTLKAGLFAGYTKNLGAGEDVAGPVYSRGANIASLMRVSPRITYTQNQLTLGTELEVTTAAYGTLKKDATVENTTDITHIRLLVSAVYKF